MVKASSRMRNAECGVRNGEGQVRSVYDVRSAIALQTSQFQSRDVRGRCHSAFRIPHSAFR